MLDFLLIFELLTDFQQRFLIDCSENVVVLLNTFISNQFFEQGIKEYDDGFGVA